MAGVLVEYESFCSRLKSNGLCSFEELLLPVCSWSFKHFLEGRPVFLSFQSCHGCSAQQYGKQCAFALGALRLSKEHRTHF